MSNNVQHPRGLCYTKADQIINERNRLDSLLNHVVKGYEALEGKLLVSELDKSIEAKIQQWELNNRSSLKDKILAASKLLEGRKQAAAGKRVPVVEALAGEDPPYNNMGGGYVENENPIEEAGRPGADLEQTWSRPGADLEQTWSGYVENENPIEEAAKKAVKYAYIKDRIVEARDNPQVTKCDALTITKPGADFPAVLNELWGLLVESGIQIQHQGRGYKYGYANFCQLVVTDDRRDTVAGVLCYANDENPRMGLMLSLKGFGCEYLRQAGFWGDLYNLVIVHKCRITFIDVALDLPGEYCKAKGITVPKLALVPGMYKHDHATKESWSDLVGAGKSFLNRDLSADTYNPEVHCLNGITYYSGAKTASNRIKTYEKGKELLGKVPVDDYEAVLKETDLAWVRIERTINPQDKQAALISPDDMLFTDKAFIVGFRGLEKVLLDFCALADTSYRSRWNSELIKREKDYGLIHVTTWLRNSYGKHIQRYLNLGLKPEQILSLLTFNKNWKGDLDPYPNSKADPNILLRIWDARNASFENNILGSLSN